MSAKAAADSSNPADTSCPYLETVIQYVDNVLNCARDVYGPQKTPLLVNQINIADGKVVEKVWPTNERFDGPVILSNHSVQQPFYRLLESLSIITGQSRYWDAAAENIRYMFANVASPSGLLYWGGHCAYDAKTDDWVGHKSGTHELKCVYPNYAAMWRADAQATKKFIEAFWNAHVFDWEVLDFSRHGRYDQEMGKLWANNYVGRSVWFTGYGLTFLNAGSDLYFAAGMLHHLNGDPAPLVWAKRLNHRYVETRDPATGMSGYQFSIRHLPGAKHWTDRAIHQFSDQLAGHVVREGTISGMRMAWTICSSSAIVRMILAQLLGREGEEFLQTAIDDMKSYGRWAYEPETNLFHPIHTDGMRLTDMVFQKEGYYGPKGGAFHPRPAEGRMFYSYAMAWRLTRDSFLWEMLGHFARGNDIGSLSRHPSDRPELKTDTVCDDPYILIGLLELWRAIGRREYLELAKKIGDNILANRFRKGFFVMETGSDIAWLFNPDPLAILTLSAALAGKLDSLPPLPALGRP